MQKFKDFILICGAPLIVMAALCGGTLWMLNKSWDQTNFAISVAIKWRDACVNTGKPCVDRFEGKIK